MEKKSIYNSIREDDINTFKSLLKNKNQKILVGDFILAIYRGKIDFIILFLEDCRINPSESNDWAIRKASKSGLTDVVRILLNDKRVNPAIKNNWSINEAQKNKHYNTVQLLWKDIRVKSTLKVDNLYLYNTLMKIEIENKIVDF
jgi:hypothetical protein